MANPARIRIGLVAVLCLALAAVGFLFVKPDVLQQREVRRLLIEKLSAWAGATVSINGPVDIQYFPRLLVDVSDVRIRDIKKLPAIHKFDSQRLQVRLSLWSVFSNEPVLDRITFIRPLIETSAETQTPKVQSGQPNETKFFSAIAGAPVDQLVITEGKVIVTGDTASETFSGIFAKISLETDGSHSARGATTWRKQEISFNYEGSVPEKLTNSSRIPVTLNLSGELVTADISGSAMIENNVRMGGDLALRIPNLAQFARWTGVLVPEGQHNGEFTADGTFQWSGHRIGFDEGSFALDGNRALGALALEFGGPRPKIDGTLALQRLDLTRYFESDADIPANSENPVTGKKQVVDLDFPLLHHINFDLRISTTDLIASPIQFGQSALSVTLEAGKLAADVAVFELCGGSGNSRMELDATVPNSRIKLNASLSGISARNCIEMFAPSSPIEGTAEITADLTSSGRTALEVLEHLRGKATVAVAAGSIAVNVDNLMTQIRKEPVVGWNALLGGSTAFKLLKSNIFLRPHAIYSESAEMDLGKTKIAGNGTVDFGQKELDLQMEYLETSLPPDAKENSEDKPVKKERFVIKGPWSQPTFSKGPRKSSAQVAPLQDEVRTARRRSN